MSKKSILVIEDEEDIRELLRYNLSQESFNVTSVESGEEGLRRSVSDVPDLILLDLMLPGLDGIEVCKKLKQNEITAGVPIIMVTAKDEESDIIIGLELGADDYITKPFSPKVLLARVKAVLRRREQPPIDEEAVLSIGKLIIYPDRYTVTVEGQPVDLTQTEFGVLHLLARRRGWVFTRYQIVDAVHGENYPVSDRSVDVQIVGLRRKLGVCGAYIETVRGVGYRFQEKI